MQFVLEMDYTKPVEGIADMFAFGGQMLLVGMGVVFAVLVLLWGCLELFHLAFYTLPQTNGFHAFLEKVSGARHAFFAIFKRSKKVEEKTVAPEPAKPAKPPKPPKAPKKKPVVTAVPPVQTASEEEDELVAVLTAAIMASSDAPRGSFRVVSFRRV